MMTITVEGTDRTPIFRALMCLYLGMTTFCCIAAFKPTCQCVVVAWAVFFKFSIALAGMINLLVDGAPSRVLDISARNCF